MAIKADGRRHFGGVAQRGRGHASYRGRGRGSFRVMQGGCVGCRRIYGWRRGILFRGRIGRDSCVRRVRGMCRDESGMVVVISEV